MTSQSSQEGIATQKNLFVPMKDGVELAIDLYRPTDATKRPVILSVYPYHKDGLVGANAGNQISYFVSRGYAYVMADCRGTGSSGGLSTDPLDGLNGSDLYELVEWLARQPWCDGNIGMTGMSYGGMTALKAASVNPPHLKAILPIMAPSSFYHNLAFPGGTLNMLGLCGAWCGLMHCMGLMPPFYQDPQGRWEGVWREHLESYIPYLIGPLEHVTYDEYWKGHDIEVDRIQAPIYIFEGWRDFALMDGIRQYTDARGPKKILIGPWIHFNLDLIALEPFDYLHEMSRWFDYWLKNIDTGIMDEPPVAVCVQGTNDWRFEDSWPVAGLQERRWRLSKGLSLKTGGKPSSKFHIHYSANPAVGTTAGLMTVFPIGIDYPHDQQPDDARSVCFDSAPLRSDLEIMGQPTCKLFVSSSMSDFNLVAKLCDVAPDGASSLVTTGWLRASHRASHEEPSPLHPGRTYSLKIPLRATGYRFKAGHRVRLSISCADFPRVWPLPQSGSITLHGGNSRDAYLSLPVAKRTGKDKGRPSFQEPDLSYLLEEPRVWSPHWRVVEDRVANTISVESGMTTEFRLPVEGRLKLTHNYQASLRGEGLTNPSMAVDTTCEATVADSDFVIKVESQMTPQRIDVHAQALRNAVVVFDKKYSAKYKM